MLGRAMTRCTFITITIIVIIITIIITIVMLVIMVMSIIIIDIVTPLLQVKEEVLAENALAGLGNMKPLRTSSRVPKVPTT
jgi:hypothetical protein